MEASRSRKIIDAALVFALALLCVSSAAAQSFPSAPVWRKEISATPISVAPPVAAGDRLFLALDSGVSARRMSDGEEVWTNNLVVDGPMAASEGFLVVQSGGALHALSTDNGNEVWTDKPGKITAQPLIHQQWLFVAADQNFIAYQVSDGVKRWTLPLGVVEERPAFEGAHMYVPVADGQLVALIVESGTELWRQEVGIKPTEPLVYGDRIFIGSAAKFFFCLKMLDGKADWPPVDVGAAVLGRAAADSKNIYFTAYDNLLRALDRRNGERKWKVDLKYRPSAGPMVSGNSVSAPGMWSTLEAYDVVTAKKTSQLAFGEKLATVPVVIETPKGLYIAVVTGSLNNQWSVMLAGPPPATVPSIKVQPLTALPGTPVRVMPVIVPRE